MEDVEDEAKVKIIKKTIIVIVFTGCLPHYDSMRGSVLDTASLYSVCLIRCIKRNTTTGTRPSMTRKESTMPAMAPPLRPLPT